MPQDSMIDEIQPDNTVVTPVLVDNQSMDPPPNVVSATLIDRIASRIPTAVVWALIAQGILSATRLLTSVTVGGFFGSGSQEQLGFYSSAFGALMILVALHEAFVTTPLTVFNQKKSKAERRSFSANMLTASLLVIGLIAAVTGILIGLQAGFQIIKPSLGAAFIAVAALAPLQLLREFSRRWLLANHAVKASAAFECLFAAIYLSVLLALVVTSSVSATAVFVAIGGVNAIGLAVWWWMYKRDFQFGASTKSENITENFRYGRWVAGENVCSVITMYLCVWLLTFKIDEAASGVFFGCLTIVLLANPFLLGVCSILAPRAAQEYVHNGWQGLRSVLAKYGGFVFSVLLAFAVGIWVYGGHLTEAFFPYSEYFATHYEGDNTVTRTLGIAMPLMGLSFVFTTGLLAVNRPQASFYSALVGMITLLFANLAFGDLNLETAAISFVASIAAGAICRFGFLIHAYSQSGEAQQRLAVEPTE